MLFNVLTSSRFRYAFELLFVPPAGVVAPFMALITPPADVGVAAPILIADPLVTIVPVGGGVPGIDVDDVMLAIEFWSRDASDCCNPIGWSILPTDEGVMVPVPWICV
jgi:hypothetical protein